MIVEIDQRSDVPIYEQLHRQFIAAIAGDELSPGDSLPSVRSLAVDLGINLHTVNKAYALLRDEGYIVMRRGAGATVAERNGGGEAPNRTAEAQDERMDSIALPWPTRRAAVIRPHSSMPPNGNANGHTACAPRRALLTVQQKKIRGDNDEQYSRVDEHRVVCVLAVAGDSDRRPGRGSMGYRPA